MVAFTVCCAVELPGANITLNEQVLAAGVVPLHPPPRLKAPLIPLTATEVAAPLLVMVTVRDAVVFSATPPKSTRAGEMLTAKLLRTPSRLTISPPTVRVPVLASTPPLVG